MTSSKLNECSDTHYRSRISKLVDWCSANNLELNVSKTNEIIVDFCFYPPEIDPLVINGSEVEIVYTFKFLGIHRVGAAESIKQHGVGRRLKYKPIFRFQIIDIRWRRCTVLENKC